MKPIPLRQAAAYTLAGLVTITLFCTFLVTTPHYWPFLIGIGLWAYRFRLIEETTLKPHKLTDAEIQWWLEHG